MTALEHHYQTQPLPTWIGWYAHNGPDWFGTLSVAIMFVIEIAVPFVILAPARFRRIRMTGCGLLCLLQALIAATGNYGFFNLLAVVLYLSLLDDDAVARLLRLAAPGRLHREALQTPGRVGRAAVGAEGGGLPPAAGMMRNPPRRTSAWRRYARAAATALLAGLSLLALVREVRGPAPMPAWANVVLDDWAGPFRSVNGYGLFRVMTTERPEIVIEGSADGSTWLEYPFRWKPGDPARAPRFALTHMPRFDWRMWFAALDPRGNSHWLLPSRRACWRTTRPPRPARRHAVPRRTAPLRPADDVPLPVHDAGGGRGRRVVGAGTAGTADRAALPAAVTRPDPPTLTTPWCRSPCGQAEPGSPAPRTAETRLYNPNPAFPWLNRIPSGAPHATSQSMG